MLLKSVYYPCKTEPTARQSSYFVRSAFVELCHGEDNSNSIFLWEHLHKEYLKLKWQISSEWKSINKGSLENQIERLPFIILYQGVGVFSVHFTWCCSASLSVCVCECINSCGFLLWRHSGT